MNFGTTIAIPGGTGPQGQGLAIPFAIAGVSVALGSREGDRAAAIAEELNKKLEGRSAAPIRGYDNVGAINAAERFVLLAVAVFRMMQHLVPSRVVWRVGSWSTWSSRSRPRIPGPSQCPRRLRDRGRASVVRK
nr:NAD(P)-binding domain-containing protein [Bradyrhizobium zhanjiangense]